MMVKCSRFCLHNSLKIVNVCTNVMSVVMIIYSLWALKEWGAKETAEGSSSSSLPKPWFIFVFLVISIVVCLSTIFGHAVSNSISILVLTVYILFLCSILLPQIGVIIVIFFKKDWISEIHEDYAGQHSEFLKFLTFHLSLCRYLVLVILLAQVVSGVLAVILWALGPEPGSDGDNSRDASTRYNLNQSFLVCCDSQPVLPALLTNNSTNEKKNLIEELY